MIGLRKYVALSSLAAGAVVYHAFYTREQYFPAVVYLTTSKFSVAVVGNFAFALALCGYHVLTKLFLGALRDAEVERLNERISSAIMETCLAMTIFREEFNVSFVAMFAILTFVKIFHWLVQDRVDYVETTPNVTRRQHFRLMLFMALLLVTDLLFLKFSVSKVLKMGGHTVMLLFAFEYIIQVSALCSTCMKYLFARLDGALEGRWEWKGVCVFYLELITDLVHLCVYVVFFCIVFMQYGLPIHLIRDLYWTIRNFRNRVGDFLRYRRVTARMDLFPDATEEDLSRCDRICIICREEMTTAGVNKKLPCNHVFHIHCLRSWLERQQSCPICRNPVFPPPTQEEAARNPRNAANREEAPQENQGGVAPPAADPANGGNAGGPGLNGVGDQVQNPVPVPPVAPGNLQEGPGDQPGPSNHLQTQDSTNAGENQQAGPADVNQIPGYAGATGHLQLPPQWGGGPMGYVWNVPQLYPTTSMAAFVDGSQMQYAGQHYPDNVMQTNPIGSRGVVPVMPVVSALSTPFTLLAPSVQPPGGGGAQPDPQQSSQAAAAVAAAAAAAAMYNPYAGLVLMPPATFIPPSGAPAPNPTPAPAPNSASTPGTGQGPAPTAGGSQQQPVPAGQAAAAARAATAAAAAVMGTQPTQEAVQATMEATYQALQNQLEALQSQMNFGDRPPPPPETAPDAAATSSNPPPPQPSVPEPPSQSQPLTPAPEVEIPQAGGDLSSHAELRRRRVQNSDDNNE